MIIGSLKKIFSLRETTIEFFIKDKTKFKHKLYEKFENYIYKSYSLILNMSNSKSRNNMANL